MHLAFGVKKRLALFLVNHIFAGTRECFWNAKIKLLNSIGYQIGEGTKVVGPLECYGTLSVGKNCWIGKNLITVTWDQRLHFRQVDMRLA